MENKNKKARGNGVKMGCHRWGRGCLLFLVLIILLVCGLLFFIVTPRQASASGAEPLVVWLLIDNSNSMFEKGGIGSDPELLRIDAARLFLNYLGVDVTDVVHKAGVIFFGGEARTVVPLTPLMSEDQRLQLFEQIANPSRLGWSDHLTALDLVQGEIENMDITHQPAIILLTDGKPEIGGSQTEAEQAVYIAALQEKVDALIAEGASLYIVLLTNEMTSADDEIVDIWQPFWQQINTDKLDGEIYIASQPSDLPDIYHDIVVSLTGRQTDGVVLETTVMDTSSELLSVSPDLEQLTLVVGKGSPTQTISIYDSAGKLISEDPPQVRRSGDGSAGQEEVWVIENPASGQWTIQIVGAGDITVWQDSVPMPVVDAMISTPTPTVVSVSIPFAADTPSAVPSLMPTQRPTPVFAETAVAVEVAVKPKKNEAISSSRPFIWSSVLVGAVLIIGAGTVVFYQRRQATEAAVTGVLRLLDGHRTIDNRVVIDLDTLSVSQFTLGKQPADLPLSDVTTQVRIRPGRLLEDVYEMLVSGGEGVKLNGNSLTEEMILTDMAILDFDGTRVRYENLRLRQAERERQGL